MAAHFCKLLAERGGLSWVTGGLRTGCRDSLKRPSYFVHTAAWSASPKGDQRRRTKKRGMSKIEKEGSDKLTVYVTVPSLGTSRTKALSELSSEQCEVENDPTLSKKLKKKGLDLKKQARKSKNASGNSFADSELSLEKKSKQLKQPSKISANNKDSLKDRERNVEKQQVKKGRARASTTKTDSEDDSLVDSTVKKRSRKVKKTSPVADNEKPAKKRSKGDSSVDAEKSVKKRSPKTKKGSVASSDSSTARPEKKKVGRKSKKATVTSSSSNDGDPERTKPKKKQVRKKQPTDEEIKDSILGPFVPFEGTSVDNFDSTNEHYPDNYSMKKEDLPEGRFYHLKSSRGSFSFPSVTTILDSTLEGSSYYRLLKWRLKLTSEYGRKGFDAIQRNTLNSGLSFHKKLEAKLKAKLSKKEKTTECLEKPISSHNVSSLRPPLGKLIGTAEASVKDVTVGKNVVDSSTKTSLHTGAEDVPSSAVVLNDAVSSEIVSSELASGEVVPSELAVVLNDGASSELTSGEVVSSEVASSDPTEVSLNDLPSSDPTEVPLSSDASLSDLPSSDPLVPGEEVSYPIEESDTSDSITVDVSQEDSKPPFPQPPFEPKYMESVHHVLEDIGEIKALETSVTHFQLGYTGTFDCLAEYKGTLCLIDWKTSSKPKPTLADCFDYPLQAVAYAGAINQDPHIDIKVLNVLIVVAYADGEPADAHLVNPDACHKYWLKWLQRLQKYQTQFAEDLSDIVI